MSEGNFKERVRQEMIKAAKKYKDIYVDYEYLICSETFEKNDYYIIAAEEDNFQHLILRKTKESLFFDEIIVGDVELLNRFKTKIDGIVSAKLFQGDTGEENPE